MSTFPLDESNLEPGRREGKGRKNAAETAGAETKREKCGEPAGGEKKNVGDPAFLQKSGFSHTLPGKKLLNCGRQITESYKYREPISP